MGYRLVDIGDLAIDNSTLKSLALGIGKVLAYYACALCASVVTPCLVYYVVAYLAANVLGQ